MRIILMSFCYRQDFIELKHENFSCNVKTLREDAHSRVKNMLLKQPRSAREFRLRNSFLYHSAIQSAQKRLWKRLGRVGFFCKTFDFAEYM